MQFTNFHFDSEKEEINSNKSSSFDHIKKSKKRKEHSTDNKQKAKLYNDLNIQKDQHTAKEPSGEISQHAKELIMKYEHQIHVDQLNLWASVARQKDKADRATIQHTLDPRTLVILCKMIKNGILKEIRGCVATGKEANVLEGLGGSGELLAIKVYRTSILGFKDRERYVNGEWRFRNGVCYSNPRKMIKIWAEKEFRNLKRMQEGGMCCPSPVLVKGNVVVMKWVGGNDGPARKLKDVQLEQEGWSKIYLEVLVEMRTLWNKCRLVHADLSEFNMLWWDDKVWIIDVAQSVEHDHPHAIQFLRMDCLNVNRFFQKKGVLTFSVKQVFDFITDLSLKSNNLGEYLQNLIEQAQPDTEEQQNMFMGVHIPRTLGEIPIKQIEKDIDQLINEGQAATDANILYAKLAGVQINDKEQMQQHKQKKIKQKQENENKPLDNPDKREKRQLKQNKEKQRFQHQKFEEIEHEGEAYLLSQLSNQIKQQEGHQSQESESDSSEEENELSSESGSEDEDENENAEKTDKKKHGWCKYEGMTKIERKKLVKEEKREKRKNKIPKKVKKQLVKKTK